jgi:alpha-D-xyloside xylohydrolase
MRTNKGFALRFALAAIPLAFLQACDSSNNNPTTSTDMVKQWASYQTTEHGVIITPVNQQTKLLRLEVMSDAIIRVTALPHNKLASVADSLIVTAQPTAKFSVEQKGEQLLIKTAEVTAVASLIDASVHFIDKDGKTTLSETLREFAPVTQDPVQAATDSYALRQQWNKGTDEGFFGLGQHQNAQVNYAGENVELTTHNLEISIPMVVSTNNYGVLWDNASITEFGDPKGSHAFYNDFELTDSEGKPGGLTAHYYDGDKLLFSRTEQGPNYQYLAKNNDREFPFPAELGEVAQPRIVWEGSISTDKSGMHKFKMYNSGYGKLSIGGKQLLDRWRMNWNPWYHNTQVEFTAGEPQSIKIEWDSQGGYMFLEHSDPLPSDEQYSLSFASESGKAIDYYYIAGDNADEIISGYRTLTGKAVLLPKWVYGFWQSRERYMNQEELVDVVKEYRKRKIPLDNIVLDWSYWPQDAWGSHKFDKKHFPDPKKMVDEVHDLHANIMISVWPKFYPTTDNYKELDAKGYMLSNNVEKEGNLDWIGPGYLNAFYDPYPEESQQIFWRQIEENLNVLGFDAWWLDASEPDMHSNLSISKRKENMTPLSIGSGTEYFNSYGLANAEGIYKGERKTDGDKRSFILTRSGFAGQQRAGAAIWSGDTVPRWSNMKEQIAAGIGVGLAGMPNWTFDIGGFTPEDKYRYTSKGTVGHFSGLEDKDVAPWQEINLRWFQFGAFVPIFRSHGQNPYREIYNLADEGSDIYKSLVYYTKLRYQLMPYIYSEAGKMYLKDNTLMRGLVMDFPKDKTAIDINDQYMFGPAFLVSPVYEYEARTRDLYLPKGTSWYDFYNGEVFAGGQHIKAAAPLNRMPLFVRAGSIVPTGVDIQYVNEKPNSPITLNVYTGADGHYTLYNDDGNSYDYEQGQYATIDISYDDASGSLYIGERQGSYSGMPEQQQFIIRWIGSDKKLAKNMTDKSFSTFDYAGKAMVINQN